MKENTVQAGRGSWLTRQVLFRALIFLAPALVYLPAFGGNIPLPPGEGAFSDLLITHYPNLIYLRESLFVHHQIPFWSSLIHSGAPFAANPLSGLFYLPGWLALLFPLPAGLSWVLAGHAVFGTWGMYRWLRLEDVGVTGSILGALSFGLMPKLAAHFGAGHVSLIYAIAWTPWLLSCSKTDREGWKTGLAAGALFLADPRWSLYAGLLWLAYEIAYRQQPIKKRGKLYLQAALIAFLIAAPLILPMIEYVGLATRADLTAADLLSGSMPATQLIGFLIPASAGNLEWYWYVGGTAAALLIFSLIEKDFRARNGFWLGVFGLGVIFSLGTFGLEIDWLDKIPILNLVRVPARSLFISGMAVSIIAGKTIDQLQYVPREGSQAGKIFFGIFAVGLLMVVGLALSVGLKSIMLIWGFSFLMISGLFYFLAYGKLGPSKISWIFGGLLLIDLLGAGLSSYRILEYKSMEASPIQSYLADEEGFFRVYSPSYSIPQDRSAALGISLADGVDPLQIEAYALFMEEATGVERTDYSVTIPPFRTGDPSRDNQGAELQSDLLGLLNVRFIVSEFALGAQGLSELDIGGPTMLYSNSRAFPRAWTMKDVVSQQIPELEEITEAKLLFYSPNRILVEAEGPGRLVLSEIFYPGWKATLDGEPVPVREIYHVLRSVDLPEGSHEILFKFQPFSVYGGMLLAVLGWLIAAYFLWGHKK